MAGRDSRPAGRRGGWRDVRVVARREFVLRVRSRALQLSTVVLLLAIVAGIVVPTLISPKSTSYEVALAPASPPVAAAVTAAARAADVTVTQQGVGGRQEAVADVESGAVDAALVDGSEVLFDTGTNADLENVLRAAGSRLAVEARARRAGLSAGELAGLLAPAGVSVRVLHPTPDRTAQTGVALIGLVLLFTALNLYGAYVLMGVVEEKSSRVVEILLARTRASALLAGKVVGIGLVGMSQFVLLGAVAVVTLVIVRPPNVPDGAAGTIAGVVLWFVLGYAFYSVCYAALGALVSRQEDAGAVSGPITVVLTAIYLLAFVTTTGDADRPWILAASLFPPTAPMFMPVRAATTSVPAWQVVLAVVLMLVATGLLVRVGGRLYRGAVLQTGARVGLRAAWRAGRDR